MPFTFILCFYSSPNSLLSLQLTHHFIVTLRLTNKDHSQNMSAPSETAAPARAVENPVASEPVIPELAAPAIEADVIELSILLFGDGS